MATSDFIGRVKDLQILQDKFGENYRIFGLFGKKGMGKSELAQRFIETINGEVKVIHCDFRKVRKLDGVLTCLFNAIKLPKPENLYKRNEDDDEDDDFVDETNQLMNQITDEMNADKLTCFVLFLDNLEFAQPKSSKEGTPPGLLDRCLWDKVYEHVFEPFLKECSNTCVVITSTVVAQFVYFTKTYVKYELKEMSDDDSLQLFMSKFQSEAETNLILEICHLCDNQPDIIINAVNFLSNGFTLKDLIDLLKREKAIFSVLGNEFLARKDKQDVKLNMTFKRLSEENRDKLKKIVTIISYLPDDSSIMEHCLQALGYEREEMALFKLEYLLPLKNRHLIDVQRKDWRLSVSRYLHFYLKEHANLEDIEKTMIKQIQHILAEQDSSICENDKASLEQRHHEEKSLTGELALPVNEGVIHEIKENQESQVEGNATVESGQGQAHNPLVPSAVHQDVDFPAKGETQNNVVCPEQVRFKTERSSLVSVNSEVTSATAPQLVSHHLQGPSVVKGHQVDRHYNTMGINNVNKPCIETKTESLRRDFNLFNQDSERQKDVSGHNFNIQRSIEENSFRLLAETKDRKPTNYEPKYDVSVRIGNLDDQKSVPITSNTGPVLPSTQLDAMLPWESQSDQYVEKCQQQNSMDLLLTDVKQNLSNSDNISCHVGDLSDDCSGGWTPTNLSLPTPSTDLPAMSYQTVPPYPQSVKFSNLDLPILDSKDKLSFDSCSRQSSSMQTESCDLKCHKQMQTTKLSKCKAEQANGEQLQITEDTVRHPLVADGSDCSDGRIRDCDVERDDEDNQKLSVPNQSESKTMSIWGTLWSAVSEMLE